MSINCGPVRTRSLNIDHFNLRLYKNTQRDSFSIKQYRTSSSCFSAGTDRTKYVSPRSTKRRRPQDLRYIIISPAAIRPEEGVGFAREIGCLGPAHFLSRETMESRRHHNVVNLGRYSLSHNKRSFESLLARKRKKAMTPPKP